MNPINMLYNKGAIECVNLYYHNKESLDDFYLYNSFSKLINKNYTVFKTYGLIK